VNDSTRPSIGAEPGWGWLPLLVIFAIVAVAANWPYVQAASLPPRGTAFIGTFYYYDDFYNYLSFVEQAERGAFLLRNKLIIGSPPRLINLEWWLVGGLSRLLGHRPFLAYRIFGAVGTFALLAGVDSWLRKGLLPAKHRVPALCLVAFGAGFGGARAFLGAPVGQCLDLLIGIFPSLEMLVNPHFVAGTCLIAWSLYLLVFDRTRWHTIAGIFLATVLALVRPYDVVTLVAAYSLLTFSTEPRRTWPRRLGPLVGLLPVVAYNFEVFVREPYFRYGDPKLFVQVPTHSSKDMFWALAPAILLALLTLGPSPAGSARQARCALGSWAFAAMALSALMWAPRPIAFALQAIVGVGLPMLVLAALGLSRFRRGWTLAATAALGTTAVFSLSTVSTPSPEWNVPAEIMQAAHAARDFCQPGDILVAPDDIGLYAAGLSSCDAYVSHNVAPGYARRARRLAAFYAAPAAGLRARLLEETCATYVALPNETAPVPVTWLGEATSFRLVHVVGRGPAAIGLYGRPRPVRCTPANATLQSP
jgi:hypothetical protein